MPQRLPQSKLKLNPYATKYKVVVLEKNLLFMGKLVKPNP